MTTSLEVYEPEQEELVDQEPLVVLDDKARELAAANLGLVYGVVGRMIAESGSDMLDREEMVSDGFIGLCQAAARFDPDNGAKFSTFADQRIRGAVLDAGRSLNHLPRGEGPKKCRTFSVLNNSGTLSFDMPVARDQSGNEQTLGEVTPDPTDMEGAVLDMMEYVERKERLKEFLGELSVAGEEVMTALLAGKSQAQIARERGVTESGIAQIVKRNTRILKAMADGTGKPRRRSLPK